MKIAIFSDFFYPEISGITDSIILLGKELAKRGHKVMFVIPWYADSDYGIINAVKNDDFGPNIIVKRLPSLPIPFSPTKQMRSPLFLGLGIYWMKKFGPDIIHTHSPLSPGYEAWLASKLFKIPFVGTNHTPMSEFLKGPKWFVDAVCRHYSKFYNKCQFVTTPSQYLLDYMIDYGLLQKAKPVSNPMDTLNFLPVFDEIEKKSLKKKFGFSPRTVLYTGRLAEEKHVDDIIRAVAIAKKMIPEISLAITGHGNVEKKLASLVTELGLEKQVRFLGFVDKDIYPLVYRASDIFTIMSTAESQSISLILGMATGLPVIGANARALPEYINNTNGAVVEVGDYKSLAKEIVKIFLNAELTKKLGEGGVITANKYSAENIAKEWEEIYKSAIAKTI